MTDVTKEKILNKQMWLNSLKMSAKIVLVVIVAFFYVISTMFFLAPKFDAKIFGFFGLKKAQESCYLQAYEKSGSAADLYNLILFEQEIGEYEKELYYINVLMAREDYNDFCKRLNDSSINNVSKNMYAYVGNTDSYLINRKVRCMYSLNLEGSYENRSHAIVSFVRNQLNSGSVYEYSFATYVSLVLNDATLTDAQRKETFEVLKNMTSSEDTNSTQTLLEERKRKLISSIIYEVETKDMVQEVILRKRLVDFYKGWYKYSELVGESSSVLRTLELEYSSALESYNNLLKK